MAASGSMCSKHMHADLAFCPISDASECLKAACLKPSTVSLAVPGTAIVFSLCVGMCLGGPCVGEGTALAPAAGELAINFGIHIGTTS